MGCKTCENIPILILQHVINILVARDIDMRLRGNKLERIFWDFLFPILETDSCHELFIARTSCVNVECAI